MSEQPELEISTLGGLRIALGGQVVADIGSRKAEALLIYLACSRRPQPREVLADLFWDERTSPQALANLRWLLTRLTQHMAPYLLVTRAQVGMNPKARYRLDAADFEDYLQQARASKPRGDSLAPHAVKLLEQAVSIYSGDFLQGFFVRESSGFEEWMLREQERLHRLATLALGDLAAYYGERGDYIMGTKYATRLAELDPFDEKAQHDLEEMLAHEGQRRPQHLPIALTPFVGRESELSELVQYLTDPECRLLTLVGPGGVGKTRLGIEAAQASPGFPDGVYFVPLDAVSAPQFVVSAIANALQYTLSGGENPMDQLLDRLRDKRLLLVLDNFEHLLAGAGLLPELLAQAPGVKLLVTSRLSLDLAAEQIYDVEGLDLPPSTVVDATKIETYSAVRLFSQRARRVLSRFNLSSGEAQYVARICRALEGLPLAIELAAIWVRTRTCEEIERSLEQGIDLLATTRHDVPARHRSLRAVFDQAWLLLTDSEARVLSRISVFRGGFDEEAALSVAGADKALLMKLVERSLLRQTVGGRYDIHEMLRQYAASKLDEQPEERENAEVEHAAFYARLVEAAFPDLVGARQLVWLERLEREHDNIRDALSKTLALQDALAALRMARSLQRFWYFRGYLREGLTWLETALALPGAQVRPDLEEEMMDVQGLEREVLLARARAANAAGVLCQDMGEREKAEIFVSESVAIFRSLGETLMLASPLNNLGLLARDGGDLVRAQTLLEESLELYREQEDRQGTAVLLNNLGKVVLWLGEGQTMETARARSLLEESLGLFEELGEPRGKALAQVNLAQAARNEHDYSRSLALFKRSLKLYVEVGDKRGQAECLEGIAEAASSAALERHDNGPDDSSNWERIAAILGGAAALRANTGARLSEVDRRYLEQATIAAQAHTKPELWEPFRANGQTLPEERLIACALEIDLSTPESVYLDI